MVESGISGIGVDLLQGNFEVSVESSQNNSWSLGCSVFVEDSNTDVQEFRTKDIALSACFQTEQITVDVNRVESNKELDVDFAINELDVNFGIGGIGGSGGAIVDEINVVKESINDIVDSMADVNEALRDINTEAINIKTTINGIQKEVNDFGTELTTKASVESILEIGELITEVQNNAIEQTMRVDALGAEVKTKATAESVTTIADQLEITNKSVAEQTLKVDDLSAEIGTKASQQMVVELGDSLKTVTDTVAEQTLKVDALGAEVATKASLDYAAELAGGIEATNKVVAEQTIKVSDLTSEIENRATVESVTKLSDALSTTTDAVAEQKIRVDGLESEISSKAENETVLAIDGKVTNVSSNLAEQTIRVDGLEASIENTVSKEDFNAATGQLNESYTSLKQTTEGLDATIKTNSGEITSIKQNIDGLSVSIKTVSDDLKAIENKIDGVTESYFLPYEPTLENEPAATWIEEGSEESHLGDTFTSTETEGETAGKSWRWLETDGVWGWVPIADTDAQKALLLASQAKEAVDGKVTIFYEQPSNYKEGDIWFVHNDNYSPYPEGEILSAIKGNATFDILDWESKTSYSKTISELDTKMNTTFKDGVLDEAERKVIADGLLSLNQEKASLDYEYNIVVGNANFYDAELKAEYKAAKDAYDEAYNEFAEIIGNIINAQEDELQGLFDSYKTASESYGEAYSNYVRSKEQVSEALSGRLNPANIYIGHIASDGYLTPIEKEQMFEIYRSLAKEYNTAKGNAYNYKIWQYAEDGETEEAGMNGTNGRYDTYVEYKESFVPIVSVFTSSTWGFDKMSETTELPEGSSTSTIKEYLDTYYECLGALSEIFSAITISIQEAQKRGEETLAELTNILAPEEMDTKIGKGVVLSTIIATKDTQGNITAGMNASNEFSDATHKRVVIAGGVNDKTDWNDSEFKLYEDGHFVAQSGELGENVKIGNALITSVLYGDINLLSYPENGKLIPLFTIEKDANGKISSVSSAYDFKVNGDLLVYGESATRGTGDPSTGGGIDENKLAAYLKEYKYINEDALLEYGFVDEQDVNDAISALNIGDYAKTSEVERLFLGLNISQYAKTSDLGDLAFEDSLSTSDVSEGTNKYFTDARAIAAVLGSSAIGSTSAYPYWDGSAWKTKTLGNLAFVNSLSKSDVGLGNVANETYAGGTAVTLNGFSKAKSTASFYAPTSAGTVGYFLKSQGVGDAPIWSALGALATKDSLTYSEVGVTKDVITYLLGTTTYAPYNANGYLPLSGGTLKSSGSDIILKLNSNMAYNAAWVEYNSNDVKLGYLGFNGVDTPSFYPTSGSAKTLIHSGNIGSQSVNKAKILIDANGSSVAHVSGNTFYIGDTIYPTTSTQILGKDVRLRYGESASYGLILNSSGNVTIGSSDLASTNYRLYVEGGAFFTEPTQGRFYARISNASIQFGNISSKYTGGYNTGLIHGTDGSSSDYLIGAYKEGSTVKWIYIDGTQSSSKMTIRNGNVGIGANNPQYKLDVNGVINTNNSIYLNTTLIGRGTYAGASLYFGGRDGEALSIEIIDEKVQWLRDGMKLMKNGNVGIGTTSPAYKLDVNGTCRISGNTTINGTITLPVNNQIQWGTTGYMIYGMTSRIHVDAPLQVSGATTLSSTLTIGGQTTINNNLIVYGESASTSDMRFKDVVENKSLSIADIAKAPCFSFTWKEKDDKSLHLGTSAQYWEAIAPELVTGEDFKALNYASLGVAMGIALAKESINHESRIKNLEDEIKILNGELKRLRYGIHQ